MATSAVANPLEILPISIRVPKSAREHRNFTEAAAITSALSDGKGVRHGGVIGTENNHRAELYGWHNPVSPHIDNVCMKTYIYGCILKLGRLKRIGLIDQESGIVIYISPKVGSVFRLDDSFPHWTEGGGGTVAIFTGEYSAPCDASAVITLQRGVNRLANGVKTAPRVSEGFRIPADDECYATRDFIKPHLVTKKLAERRDWTIALCECGKVAHRLDKYWPFDSYGNSCNDCYAKQHKDLD